MRASIQKKLYDFKMAVLRRAHERRGSRPRGSLFLNPILVGTVGNRFALSLGLRRFPAIQPLSRSNQSEHEAKPQFDAHAGSLVLESIPGCAPIDQSYASLAPPAIIAEL
jgi:hypothetical protein